VIKSIIGIAFDCPNANELADFYVKLSGWNKEISSDEWATLRTPEGILFVFRCLKPLRLYELLHCESFRQHESTNLLVFQTVENYDACC